MSWVCAFATLLLASLVLVETKDKKCFSYTGELEEAGDAIGTGPFVEIGEGLFLIETENTVNWFEANEICRRYSAQLASIETEEEMQSLSAYLTRTNINKHDNMMWLSGTNLHNKAEYVWMGTGQPLDYENWDDGQPDGYEGIENCTLLWYKENGWRWNDGICTVPKGYICEGKRQTFKYQLQFEFE